MGWNGIPINTGDNFDPARYSSYYYQISRALAEKFAITCQEYFPAPTYIWAEGTVSKLRLVTSGGSTYVVMADLTQVPTAGPPAVSGWQTTAAGVENADEIAAVGGSPAAGTTGSYMRWSEWCSPIIGGGCDPTQPKNYDLILGSNWTTTPNKILHVQIQGNGFYVLRLSDLGLTQKELSAYEGARYSIIRRFGVMWHERIPWANPPVLYKSQSSLNNALSIYPKVEADNALVGKKIAYTDAKGNSRYGKIASNTGSIFTYTPDANARFGPAANTRWAIMADANPATTFWFADTVNDRFNDDHVWNWYTGGLDSYWSHQADDSVGGAQFPITSVLTGNQNCNGSDTKNGFDLDYYQSWDDSCPEWSTLGTRDAFLGNGYWKSLRSMQAGTEWVCSNFLIDNQDFTADLLRNFCPAYLLNRCGINAVSGATVVDPADNTRLGIGSYTPPLGEAQQLYYCFKDPSSIQWHTGCVTVPAAGGAIKISFDGADAQSGGVYIWDGVTVYASWGWTRYQQRFFLHFYNRHFFEPDVVDGIAQGPGPTTAGNWTLRSASTKYGYVRDDYACIDTVTSPDSSIGFTYDGTVAFKKGDTARYTGDNFQDPVGGIYATAGANQDLGTYYALGPYEGKLATKHNADYSGTVGTVANASGLYGIKDSTKSWYVYGDWGGFTGTATAGSSGSIVCETAKPGTSGGVHYGDDRWSSATGRWVGFTVEILNGPLAGQKAPITAFDDVTCTISFVLPGFSWQFNNNGVLTPVQFRIHEPKYVLNRWEGRQIQITTKDGSTGTGTIVYNADDTLWYSGGIAPQQGSSYTIIEKEPGTCWTYDGSQWQPAGDTVQLQKSAKPTIVKRYGRAMKYDYPGPWLLNELRTALNVLYLQGTTLNWTKSAVSGVSENNQTDWTAGVDAAFGCGEDPTNNWPGCTTGNYNNGIWCGCVQYALQQAGDATDTSKCSYTQIYKTQTVSSNSYPATTISSTMDDTLGGASLTANSNYAYANSTVGCGYISHTFHFWAKGDIDGTHTNGQSDDCGSGSPCYHCKWTYDNNGSGVPYEMYGEVGAVGPTTSTAGQLKVGNTNVTTPPCNDPGICEGSFGVYDTYSGYEVIGQRTIVEWHCDYHA